MLYPDFKPLELDDKPVFDQAFKNYPPIISEFTFTNLYAFRNAYQFSFSYLDNCLIIRAIVNKQPCFFMPVASDKDSERIIREISKETHLPFFRITQNLANLFTQDNEFFVAEDVDNSDYLYKTEDLVVLKGSRYDGKRNLIAKFKSGYQYEYLKIDRNIVRECLKFEDDWCIYKDCDNVQSLDAERTALKEMFKYYEEFHLLGAAIRVNGAIRAIAIAESLNPDTLVIHMLKADQNISGLYQAMLNEFLSKEAGGFKFINMEQDLGVLGLRKAKMSYHPIGMVKKYTVKQKKVTNVTKVT